MDAFDPPGRVLMCLLEAVSTSNWTLALKIIQDASGPGPLAPENLEIYALHAAVAGGSSKQFVQNLVNVMPPDSLEKPLIGRTALHVAAMAGNTDAAKILVEKRSTLVHIVDNNDEPPLHLAARHARAARRAHKETVRYLLEVTDKEDPEGAIYGEAGAKLLKLLIIADFYGDLLHILKWQCAIPQSMDRAEFEYPHAIDLLRLLIGEILKRELESAADILGRQLCSAAPIVNFDTVVEILGAFPAVLWYRNEDGHGFFELAVLNRRSKLFNLLYRLGPLKHIKDYLLQTKDHKGNNILHLAARTEPLSAASAPLQVLRDVHWFKEIERNVQRGFRYHTNNEGKTPSEVFVEEHKKLIKEGDEWMKKTAESCTVVAALVVTVLFAAAFTVPGGNNDSNGIPHYLTNASFMTFAISVTLGLVSSTGSLLMFLGILSSRFSEAELLNTVQYMRLGKGLVTLFCSIASMLVAFTASLQIVLGHRVKWIAVPIGILASLPVMEFVSQELPLLFEIVYWTLRPILFPGGKVVPYFPAGSIF